MGKETIYSTGNWLQIMKTAAQEAEAGLEGQGHLWLYSVLEASLEYLSLLFFRVEGRKGRLHEEQGVRVTENLSESKT